MLHTNTRQLSSYLNQYGFVQDEKESDIPITSDTIIRRYDTLNPAPAGFETLYGFCVSNGSANINDKVPFFSEDSSVVDKWVKDLQNFRGCLRTIKQINEASGDATIRASVSETLEKQGWLYKKPPRGAPSSVKERLLWFQLRGPPYKLLLFTTRIVLFC